MKPITKMEKVGPGGKSCACCTKGKWQKLKPLIRRAKRRKAKIEVGREVVGR